MIRMTLAAMTALTFSYVAHAAEPAVAPKADAAAIAVQSAEMTLAAQAQQARGILAGQGYTAISELQRDESGRWTGMATKDGTAQPVAIMLPPKTPAKAQ